MGTAGVECYYWKRDFSGARLSHLPPHREQDRTGECQALGLVAGTREGLGKGQPSHKPPLHSKPDEMSEKNLMETSKKKMLR